MNRHSWRSVVVNLRHIWECRWCGAQRNPMPHDQLPADGCPGRR